MVYPSSERLATSILRQCDHVKNVDGMNLYKLPLGKNSATVNRYSFGELNLLKYKTSKTILLMGATGSGKTTWINAMINYVLGVEWDDPFRFALIDEEVHGGSQAHSQTQGVTVYDIHYQEGFRIPFSLTIVDTPGFGDTQGTEKDEKITCAIADLFNDKNGIQELDAVGFVVQSALVRLTASQKYIFNSVLSIFGKDVKENIRFLATFADGKKPKVLEAIKEAQLPCRLDSNGLPCFQKFNNGAIYVNNQNDDDEYSLIEWKNAMKNFKFFFDQVNNMPTRSLQMTLKVLENRKQLEMKLQWTQNAIPRLLTQMEELRTKEAAIELRKMEVDAHQNFEIQVPVSRNVQEDVDHQTALNCTQCRTTCHSPCNRDLPMGWCPAFSLDFWQQLMNTFREVDCKICPGNCSSRQHVNEYKRWIYKDVIETQTLEDVREKYEKALGKKMDAEGLVEALKRDVGDLKKDIVNTMELIRDLHNELKKNALHGHPLTTPEYIRMMIDSEKRVGREGFEERIKSLEELLMLA